MQISKTESASSNASMPGGQILTHSQSHQQQSVTHELLQQNNYVSSLDSENTLQQDQLSFQKQGHSQNNQQSQLPRQSSTSSQPQTQIQNSKAAHSNAIEIDTKEAKVSEDLQSSLENQISNHIIINSNSQLNTLATSLALEQTPTLSTDTIPQSNQTTEKPFYAIQLPQLRVFRLSSQGQDCQVKEDKIEDNKHSSHIVQTQPVNKKKSNSKSTTIQEEVKSCHKTIQSQILYSDYPQSESQVRTWFTALSNADKQLACSLIDPEISKCIIDMEIKCREIPESHFKICIQQNKDTESFISENSLTENKSNFSFEPQQQMMTGRMDFGSCINFGLTQDPGQSIILHQKELLDYTRFTYVQLKEASGSQEEESCFLSSLPYSVNTLTISQLAFSDGLNKLMQLGDRILDKKFLQKPLKVEFNKSGQVKSFDLPEWVQTDKYHERAYWILAFMEIAIQINYQLSQMNTKNKFAVSPLNQLIDSSNKIYQTVRELNQKYLGDSCLKQSNSEELKKLFEKGGQSATDNYDYELLLMLYVNQPAEMFANNLVLTQIENVETCHFDCCRYFSNVLLGHGESKTSDKTTKKALKNQKKKNKRKLKKAQQQQQQADLKPEQVDELEEEKVLPNQEDSQVDQDFKNLLTKEPLQSGVTEGKSLFKKSRKESHKGESHGLLAQDNMTMIPGTLEFQDILSDSCIFQLFEGDLKDEHEDNRSHSREGIDKISSFSESTVDILGNFSSNYQSHLKSPQHSTNTQIELEMHKNIYSSDAGDSNSIQLQKQFSDYCLAKGELSNINNDVSNKLKESLDNLQVDVSLSNDNTLVNNTNSAIKQEDCNSKNHSASKKQPSPVVYNKPVSKFGSNSKANQVFTRNDEEEEKSTKFEIIRSAQSYIHDQQIQRQQQNQRKKKNKSAKKPTAGQPVNNQGTGNKTQTQQRNMSAQSNILNSFMRKKFQPSRVTHNEDEEYNYEEEPIEEQQETADANLTCSENPEGESKGDLNYQDAISQSFKPRPQANSSKAQKQQIYVKKGQLPENSVPLVKTVSTNSQQTKNQDQQSKSISNSQVDQSLGASSNGRKKPTKGTKGKQSSNAQWERGAKKKTSRGKGNGGGNHGGLQKQNSCLDQSNYDPLQGQGFGPLSLDRQSSIPESHQLILEIMQGWNANTLHRLLQQTSFQQDMLSGQYQNTAAMKNYMGEDPEVGEQEEQILDPETKVIEHFFELFESQMRTYQKQIEKRLESVRKERENAIQIIRNIVNSMYKDERNSVAVRLYGSMASNLSIETSDVDLAVVGLDFQGSKERQIDEMKRLVEQISLIMKNSTKAKLIDTATVPVIKLEIDLVEIAKKQERSDRHLGSMSKANQIDAQMRYLGIDITFEETVKQNSFYGVSIENPSRINLGIKCINYIKELCMNTPGLQTIVLILKKLLHAHDLNQTFTGGLNSYSVVLMTAAYLQKFHQVKSISKNIMEFLNFYGSFFDPSNTMITMLEPYYLSLSSFSQQNLVIVDPLNSQNNPGRGAYQIMRIKQVFSRAYEALNKCQSEYLRDQQEIDIVQVLLGASPHSSSQDNYSLNSLNSSGNKSNNQL